MLKIFSPKLIVALVCSIGLFFQLLSPFPTAEASSTYTYYVKTTANLYSSTSSSKKKLTTVPINTKLTTSTSKSSKMYKVTYKGKKGYVYSSNLSKTKVKLSFFVKKGAGLYSNTTSKKVKLDALPINTKVTTTSIKTDKMYRVTYGSKTGYVYASNLSTKKVSKVPFGQTVRIGNFTVKVNNPVNQYGSSYLYDDANYISLYVVIKNYGPTQIPGFFPDLYINDKFKDALELQFYSTKYNELDTIVELAKGKTLSGYLTYQVSPGKKLELVYRDFDNCDSMTFLGTN